MPNVRVLIVADDPLVRGGLSALLGGASGIIVSGTADAAEDIANAAAVYAADVLLWDLGAGQGLDALAAGTGTLPPVMGLVRSTDTAASAWSAGVRGLLLRDVPGERLAAALVALAEGAVVLDEDIALVIARRGGVAPSLSTVDTLTPRELDVLRLLAEGMSNKAIAARLEVTENTVKFHITAIFGKLGVQSRTEAVTRATRLGLVPL